MDTRFLETFVRVVETGSIAAAARSQNLTAASVSQRIKSLESSLGSRLIARSGRTVRPTAAGARVMAQAAALLRQSHDLRSLASETALPAGPLLLGTTPTGMTGLLPPVLKQWVQRHPDIEIYIEPAPTVVLHARVLAGDLDAAILVHPLFELPKACLWQPLREEPLILLAPAGVTATNPIETMRREPFVLYDRKVVGGRLADNYLRLHGIKPRVRFELDGIDSIARLVAEGLGVSLLPDWAITGEPDARVRRWPLPAPCPHRTVGLLSMRNSVRAPLVALLAQLALDQPSTQGVPRRRPAS